MEEDTAGPRGKSTDSHHWVTGPSKELLRSRSVSIEVRLSSVISFFILNVSAVPLVENMIGGNVKITKIGENLVEGMFTCLHEGSNCCSSTMF